MNKKSMQKALSIENKKFKRNVDRYRDSINSFAIVGSAGALPASGEEITEGFPASHLEVLKTILENQNKILENQKQMKEQIEIIEENMKDHVVDNCVLMANSRTTRECKVILEKLHKSINRLTGREENELQIEIGATLPLSSIDAAQDVEEKLEQPDYLEAMKSYLFQLKGGKGTVDDVFRKLMTDELLSLFNFDGRMERRALVKLTLINKLLCDVFAAEGRKSFEKQLRKCVELSHNRYKHRRKFIKKQSSEFEFMNI